MAELTEHRVAEAADVGDGTLDYVEGVLVSSVATSYILQNHPYKHGDSGAGDHGEGTCPVSTHPQPLTMRQIEKCAPFP